MDPADLFGPVLGPLLASGCKLTYTPDPAWEGSVYADVRDASGRLIETGNGAGEEAALADLQRRLAAAQDRQDDFVQDRHADLDPNRDEAEDYAAPDGPDCGCGFGAARCRDLEDGA
jgi:hypothetical protein